MIGFSSDSVMLANVSEAFATQWVAGASRRIALAAPIQIVGDDHLRIDEPELVAAGSAGDDFAGAARAIEHQGPPYTAGAPVCGR